MNTTRDTDASIPTMISAARARSGGESRAAGARRLGVRIRQILLARLSAGPRVELVGADGLRTGRTGSLALCAPLLAGGYLLVLAGVARLVAPSLGWTATLLALGGLQVALGLLAFRPPAGSVTPRVPQSVLAVEVIAEEESKPAALPLPFRAVSPASRLPPPFPPSFRSQTRNDP